MRVLFFQHERVLAARAATARHLVLVTAVGLFDDPCAHDQTVRAKFFRLGFACGEPLGAKTSMKKSDGSAFGLTVGEPLTPFADAGDMYFSYTYHEFLGEF